MSYTTPKTTTVVKSASLTNTFLRGIYQWMAIGLAVTAAVAWYVAGSPAILNAVFGSPVLLIFLVVAQFGIVIALSAALNKLSAFAATTLFMLYSGLTGVTLSSIFVVYTMTSITSAFVSCAGMFAAMSIYGLITKRDLTSWSSFLVMGLVGVLIAMLVNIFLKSSALNFMISIAGIIVFLGLTAFDTQKLRNMGEVAPMDDATAIRRGTIYGALTLYLDFINLFLMLLRLFGDRR